MLILLYYYQNYKVLLKSTSNPCKIDSTLTSNLEKHFKFKNKLNNKVIYLHSRKIWLFIKLIEKVTYC